MTLPISAAQRPTAPTLSYAATGPLPSWSTRFLTIFAGVQLIAMLALCLPVWTGAVSSDFLGMITPLAMWLPALVAGALHVLLKPPVRFGQWSALGVRPLGRTLGTTGLLLLAMFFVPGATTATASLLGVADFAPAEDVLPTMMLVAPLLVITMVMTLGEEIAWRGYLTYTLAPWGFWRSALAIGAFWSLWHLPLTASYWIDGALAGREVAATSVNLLLAAIVLSAVRYFSRSVWPAVAGHAMLNTILVFAYSNLITPTSDLPEASYWSYTAISWAVWGVLIAGLARKVRRDPPPLA